MEFYDVAMPLDLQPSLVLSVERDELGIAAGLQDRVIQVYEGLVYMDFSEPCERRVDGLLCYSYERLDPESLPPIYVAYHAGLSEPTDVFHNDVRGRFDRGEPCVVNAMRRAAELADTARRAIVAGDAASLARAIDDNLDVRRSIYRLPPWQVQMADANFAGSGGAIVGTYATEAAFDRLRNALASSGCRTIKPSVEVERSRSSL